MPNEASSRQASARAPDMRLSLTQVHMPLRAVLPQPVFDRAATLALLHYQQRRAAASCRSPRKRRLLQPDGPASTGLVVVLVPQVPLLSPSQVVRAFEALGWGGHSPEGKPHHPDQRGFSRDSLSAQPASGRKSSGLGGGLMRACGRSAMNGRSYAERSLPSEAGESS